MRLAWPWLVLFLLVVLSGHAVAQFNGCPPGFCNQTGASAPPATNDLLLEDGASSLLLEDGVSSLCLEGGC